MFTYGFYDSLDGDRKYDAMQMSSIFDGIIEDGVYANVGEALMVVPGTGLQVIVKTGRAWFKHTWNLNDSYMPLEIEEPDQYRTRIDAVVIEVDRNLSVRANSIKVVKGTAATTPNKPIMKHEEGIDQYALAYVTVDSEATAIVESKIEIAVGKNETPFVQCPLKTVSIEDLFNQWNGEFDEWFDNLKAQLTDNVVTNLQNQIDGRVKISDRATEDDIKNGTEGKWVDAKNMKDASRYLSAAVGEIIESPGVNLEKLYPEKFKELNQQVIKDPPEYLKEKYFRPIARSGSIDTVFPIPNNGYVTKYHYNMSIRNYELFIDMSFTLTIFDVDTETIETHTLVTSEGGKIIYATCWREYLFYVLSNHIIIRYNFGEWDTPTITKLVWPAGIITDVSNLNFDTTLVNYSELTFDGEYISLLSYMGHARTTATAGKYTLIARSRDLFAHIEYYALSTDFSYSSGNSNYQISWAPAIINTQYYSSSTTTGQSISHLHKYNNKYYLVGLGGGSNCNVGIVWELDLASERINSRKVCSVNLDEAIIGFNGATDFATLAKKNKLVIFGPTRVSAGNAIRLPGVFVYDIDSNEANVYAQYDRKNTSNILSSIKNKPILRCESTTVYAVYLEEADGEFFIYTDNVREVRAVSTNSFEILNNSFLKISLDLKTWEFPINGLAMRVGFNVNRSTISETNLDSFIATMEDNLKAADFVGEGMEKLPILYHLEKAQPYAYSDKYHFPIGKRFVLFDKKRCMAISILVIWPVQSADTTNFLYARERKDEIIVIKPTYGYVIIHKNEMVLPYKPGSYIAIQ